MKRVNYPKSLFSPTRGGILKLVLFSLWMNFAGDAMGQVTNRAASGAEYTQSGNAIALSDNTNSSTRSDFAVKLDHINYNGNIYVLYKNNLNQNLVDHFDDEFNLPSDYIFFGFTKDKAGTGKGESKVSVFNSRFRDQTQSNALQSKFTAGLKLLKAQGNLNQTSVLQLAYDILEEEYGTNNPVSQNNSTERGSQTIQNTNPENTSNSPEEESNENIYIWVFGILIVLGGGYLLHRKYPNLFIAAESNGDESGEKQSKGNELDEKLQSDIYKLQELVRQHEYLSDKATKFSYILPGNFQEILDEAYERVKIFQNAVRTGTFEDNKGLLGTTLGKAGKIKEDLSLTENALAGLQEIGQCASIVETLEYLKNEIDNIENGPISDKQIAVGESIVSELEAGNSSRIQQELGFKDISEIKSAKKGLIEASNAKLEELTGEKISAASAPGNPYEDLLINPQSNSTSSPRKNERRKSSLDNKDYLLETSAELSDYKGKFEKVKTRLIGLLENTVSLKAKIMAYEIEFKPSTQKFEDYLKKIEGRKNQYPQLETINGELTRKLTSSTELLHQANNSHKEEKKDRPKINNSLDQAIQGIQEVEGAYENFHKAKEDYFTNIDTIRSNWANLAVYIQDTDYNSLPEYVSQLHLAQKIDKLSNADNKQENWIELHKNSQIIYRTLVELKDKFEEYKQAKENYESNLQAIVSLNVRLVDLASDAGRTYHQVIVIPQQGNRVSLETETDRILKQMRATESDFEDDISRASNNSTVVVIGGGNSGGGWNNGNNNGNNSGRSAPDPTPDYAANDNSGAGDEI